MSRFIVQVIIKSKDDYSVAENSFIHLKDKDGNFHLQNLLAQAYVFTDIEEVKAAQSAVMDVASYAHIVDLDCLRNFVNTEKPNAEEADSSVAKDERYLVKVGIDTYYAGEDKLCGGDVEGATIFENYEDAYMAYLKAHASWGAALIVILGIDNKPKGSKSTRKESNDE